MGCKTMRQVRVRGGVRIRQAGRRGEWGGRERSRSHRRGQYASFSQRISQHNSTTAPQHESKPPTCAFDTGIR